MSDVNNPKLYHKWSQRIYFEHTDAAGLVYYARYLNFLEQARTEFLRSYGFNHQRLKQNHQIIFVVKKVSVNYLKPAKLDDEIIIESTITKLSGASMIFEQRISNQSKTQVLLEADVKIACLNLQFKPMKIPKMLKIALSESEN